jgi:hypothetical protein
MLVTLPERDVKMIEALKVRLGQPHASAVLRKALRDLAKLNDCYVPK